LRCCRTPRAPGREAPCSPGKPAPATGLSDYRRVFFLGVATAATYRQLSCVAKAAASSAPRRSKGGMVPRRSWLSVLCDGHVSPSRVWAYETPVPRSRSRGRHGCGLRVTIDSTTEPVAQPHSGRSHRPYTHCGIEWAEIDGSFWRATEPLSDGNGNPPAGWGNPVQQVTLVLISPTTARFDSPVGSVTFKRTSRRRPPVICS